MAKEDAVKSGLGGWLIFDGLGIIISPFRFLMTIPEYLPIFEENMIEDLVSINPLWEYYIWTEIIMNLIIFLCSIYLVFLFFAKKTIFPKFYIWLLYGSLVLVIVDAVAGGVLLKEILPEGPFIDPESRIAIGTSLVSTIVWVPYLMLSKRVKATFVK